MPAAMAMLSASERFGVSCSFGIGSAFIGIGPESSRVTGTS
jgi:hypothetical protein